MKILSVQTIKRTSFELFGNPTFHFKLTNWNSRDIQADRSLVLVFDQHKIFCFQDGRTLDQTNLESKQYPIYHF